MKRKDLVIVAALGILESAAGFGLERGVERAGSLTQNGITAIFDGVYAIGRYVSGDYWVVDPGSGVRIEETSHVAVSGVLPGERLTKNPRWNKEAMDSREDSYVAAYAISPPAILRAGDSVIINTSLAQRDTGSYIHSAIIITIVDAAQAATKFRPPYARPTRIARSATDPLIFDSASITPATWDKLPGLPIPGGLGLEPIKATQARIRGPWIDITNRFTGNCSPVNQMQAYGRDLSADVSAVCAQLCFAYNTVDLRRLAAYLIQYGIDTYGIILDGGSFSANGGTNSGRKMGLVFAAEMLGSSALASTPRITSLDGSTFYTFQEDGQTYWYNDPAIAPNPGDLPGDRANGKSPGAKGQLDILNGGSGDAALWRIADGGPGTTKDCLYEHIPIADWNRDGNDNGESKWEGYRASCNSFCWVGQAVLMLLWKNTNLVTLWNHDVFFDYIYRWMTQSVTKEMAVARAWGQGDNPLGFFWPNGTQPSWVKNVYTAYKGRFNYVSAYYAP